MFRIFFIGSFFEKDLRTLECPLPEFFTYGKIRASIAQVGNDAPPYSLTSVFVPGIVTNDPTNSLITDGYQNSLINFPLFWNPVTDTYFP